MSVFLAVPRPGHFNAVTGIATSPSSFDFALDNSAPSHSAPGANRNRTANPGGSALVPEERARRSAVSAVMPRFSKTISLTRRGGLTPAPRVLGKAARFHKLFAENFARKDRRQLVRFLVLKLRIVCSPP